jgi:hypothetical protein
MRSEPSKEKWSKSRSPALSANYRGVIKKRVCGHLNIPEARLNEVKNQVLCLPGQVHLENRNEQHTRAFRGCDHAGDCRSQPGKLAPAHSLCAAPRFRPSFWSTPYERAGVAPASRPSRKFAVISRLCPVVVHVRPFAPMNPVSSHSNPLGKLCGKTR